MVAGSVVLCNAAPEVRNVMELHTEPQASVQSLRHIPRPSTDTDVPDI